MDYLIKIALTGIVVSILIFLLKGFKSDFAPALAAVGSVVLLGAVLTLIDGAADAVKELFQSSELESEHIKNLLKIIGAAYIVDFSASLCRDNKMPILVFNLSDPENIYRAVCGENIGTIVKEV